MNAKNFVNFHVLISHSPSCLNRDDMNMQKTAVFGGMKRVRISSQSLKRAMRKSAYYLSNLGTPSFRTRNLEKAKEELVRALEDDFDRNLIEEAAVRFVSDIDLATDEGAADTEYEADELEVGDDGKKRAVAPWVAQEIREICQLIRQVRNEGFTDEEREKALKKVGKTIGKGKDKRVLTEADCMTIAMNQKIAKRLEEGVDSLKQAIGYAADVALSGRMATSGLMLPVDGALAMAHAITTHAVEPQDVDWFTAVDDLTQDAGETGAGHLNTQEFSAGVFYRYASLNLKQLQVNLGLLNNMESAETPETRNRALEIAKHIFHMLATVVPTAKRQPFAPDNPADFAIVSFSDLPLSLSNAFEEPVPRAANGGYLKPSIKTVSSYWKTITDFHSLQENAAAASSCPIDFPDGLKNVKSLSSLENWIENDGNEKA